MDFHEKRLTEWLKRHQNSGFIYGNPINSGGEEENFRNKAFQIIDNQTLGDYLIIDDIKDLTSKDIVKIKELAVNHRKRNYGSSNYGTFSRLIYGIVDIIRVLYYIKRFKNAKLHRKSQ